MKYVKVFKEEKMVEMNERGFSKATVVTALEKFMNNPNLMRRLVNIKNSGCKLTRKLYNPWYDEMIAADVTEDHVDVVEAFLKYSDGKKLEELADYTHSSRGAYGDGKTVRLMIPYNHFVSF